MHSQSCACSSRHCSRLQGGSRQPAGRALVAIVPYGREGTARLQRPEPVAKFHVAHSEGFVALAAFTGNQLSPELAQPLRFSGLSFPSKN